MIPLFPIFKKIDIEDKKSIESYTHKHPPYSDFNFTSLWAWDTHDERMISKLNDNLVIRFTDYETGAPFFSFLGTNETEQTATELINFANKEGISPILRFVPEESIINLKNSILKIEEDKNNFDYIFSVSELANLKGIKYKEKRHSSTKFTREHHKATFELKKINDSMLHNQIISVLKDWNNKKKTENKTHDLKHEENAINRLFQEKNEGNLIVSCVLLNEIMIGFSIDEILPSNYAISHFIKADYSHAGVYDFLNKNIAEYLATQNITLWNWEQDLGISNLRKSKTSYNPVNFLKKYKISLFQNK